MLFFSLLGEDRNGLISSTFFSRMQVVDDAAEPMGLLPALMPADQPVLKGLRKRREDWLLRRLPGGRE